MRVTTKMINNNLIGNINSNKNSVFKLQEQYASGKAIQRPSDDPVVASRALRLRSSISEMEQFLNKNIPDAMSWMSITESALKNINEAMDYIYSDLVHGANDPLTTEDRKMIQENLIQLKSQVYQESNANYAGRYVFTGYRTNDSMTFQYGQEDELYTITENINIKDDIKRITRIDNIYTIQDCKDKEVTEEKLYGSTTNPKQNNTKDIGDIYRIRLSYDDINAEEIHINETTFDVYDETDPNFDNLVTTGLEKYGNTYKVPASLPDPDPNAAIATRQETTYDTTLASDNIVIKYTDEHGTEQTIEPYKTDGTVTDPHILIAKSTDKDIYDKLNDPTVKMLFFTDTGEVIMNRQVYDEVYKGSDLNVVYDKNRYKTGDVKPEHYFDCTKQKRNTSNTGWEDKKITYKLEDQDILYEVNFSQNMNVNSQLKDIVPLGFSRCIDDVTTCLGEVNYCEKKLEDIKKILDDPTMTDSQKKDYELLKEQCEIELALRNKALSNSFQNALAEMSDYKAYLNIGIADLGSRYNRLELIQNRLTTEVMDYTELLSTNEDVDMVETYVKFNSMQNIYNASLNMASKITQNSLLDFI